MPDAHVVTYTDEQLMDALMNAQPSHVRAAAQSLVWLVKHDDEGRSLAFWVGASLEAGAAAKQRGMEATKENKRRKLAEQEQLANMGKFANALAMNPAIMQNAKAGDINLLLNTAAAFKIPTDVVLGFLAKASVPADKPAEGEAAAA